MSKAKMQAAKELIQEKKYDDARKILATVDHPTAREWEAKLDRLSPPATPTPTRSNRTRGIRIWRNIWAVLALLSFGWICYGFMVSSQAYTEVSQGASQAGQAGAAIGASMGIGLFLCTGLPFALIFLYAYSRAGAAIRSERQHHETLEALGRR
jgi:hypothetical protein